MNKIYDSADSASSGARVLGYDTIRFFATLMILIWHFRTTCIEELIPFPFIIDGIVNRGGLNFGGVGVGLFFILSGALLIKKDIPITQFYKTRFIRILVPQWIGFIVAFLLTYVRYGDIKIGIIDYMISFFGLNYCSLPWSWWGFSPPWLIGEWFTAVIILIYLAFPVLRKLFFSHRLLTSCIIIVLFGLNLKIEFLTA